MHGGVYRAVALALELHQLAVDLQLQLDALHLLLALGRRFKQMVAQIAQGGMLGMQVGGVKQFPNGLRGHLAAMGIGIGLHLARELHLQAPGHDHAVVHFHQVGHAALAALAVDADDRVVAATQVSRVDRHIGHIPDRIGLLRRQAFFDGVLV